MNNLFVILSEAVKEWLKDDASLLAAALAYYGLFSFVPLVILILMLFNLLFQHGPLAGQVVAASQDLVGQQMPNAAEDLIDRATDQASSFSFTLINIGLLIFGAAGLFVHTRRAFRIIWKIPDRDVPLMNTIINYLHSYLLIALVAFLLLATSVFTALLMPVGKQIEEYLPIHLGLLRILTFWVSFCFVAFLFAGTYKTLIEVTLQWRDVLFGSALAALLVAAGNFCIETYVSIVNVGSAYGAAGSLVIFLFWIYYSAQIFLFGAEVIKVQKMKRENEQNAKVQ
jgi:membrane protein